MPAHIMFLELIIGPACSIFFEAEAEEKNIMQRPPRKADEALFSGKRLAVSLLQGVTALIVATAIYMWARATGYDEDTTRALVFTAMVAGNIALVFGNRTASLPTADQGAPQNPVLRWILLGTGSGLALVLSVPLLRELFHFSGNTQLFLHTGLLAAAGTWLLSTAVKRAMNSHNG
jgi:Ca2+-transporting ATPase